MSVIDVLRPISVRKNGSATVVPSGTLAAVTSDNSDSSYAAFSTAVVPSFYSSWSVRVGSHTPAAGYGRHQIRGRIRIRTDTGTLTEDIDLGRGLSDYIRYGTVPVNSTVTERFTDWFQDADYGLNTAGALADLNIGGGTLASVTGGATEARTTECYVDIDCRLQPQYAAQVRDNAGNDKSGGTVTDTNQPVLYIGPVAYDGLPAFDWAVAIFSGATQVFFRQGSGAPPSEVEVDTDLNDGAYTAYFSVASLIRGTDGFGAGQAVNFSIQNTVPPPSPPLLSIAPEDGGYRLSWEYPGGQTWDNDYVVTEVWRDDCTGSQRIAVLPDALTGSYLDLAIPQLDPQPTGPGCTDESEACDITYRVRYQGYVSTYVGLPSQLPASLILAWPGTAASIPSGWSRVTALDGYYPRGATGTGAPTSTGGTTSHSHTTPGHLHQIAAHSHSAGGITGTSNLNATSGRYNGASKPQADQPHHHAIPASTGSAGPFNTGSASPGTSVVNNLPPTREVIWIASDGARTAYPIGAVAWSAEAISGWTFEAVAVGAPGYFLRGAGGGANGGATYGSATHTHTVNSHSHTGVSHNHSIGVSGLSNPLSAKEASGGSTSPRWLPRHTHPLDIDPASTGNTSSGSGGVTEAVSLDPPNRRMRIITNQSGGAQTRVIGLYLGSVGAIDPLLSLCDGSNGTPDMRGIFMRSTGQDSVNTTGGALTHDHWTPYHDHGLSGHSHDIDVLASTTTSYERPSPDSPVDLGSSPTTSHGHSAGSTGSTSPDVKSNGSGDTSVVSHVPPYREVHFVRVDGVISSGSLPVPELKVSDFASVTVPSLVYGDDLDRLSSLEDTMAVVTDRSSDFPRLVTDSTPLDGGLHSLSVTTAGEDLNLTIAVEGFQQINQLEDLLASDRLYWSPLGGEPGWFAPGSWRVTAPVNGVKVVQVTMVRQPWPSTPDPEEFL